MRAGKSQTDVLALIYERKLFIMAETKYNCQSGRDSVCIEAARVLDSCRDRDCFENVKVFLGDFGNDVIERSTNIRVKDACICNANISLDPIAFNRGFYTVNARLYLKICFEACIGCDRSQEFEGIAVVDKKAVLYGGENNITVFKSTGSDRFCSCVPLCSCSGNLPTATVELAEPIILSVGVYEKEKAGCCCCVCCCEDIPDEVYTKVDCHSSDGESDRILAVSIGLFSVVKITRNAQYLISAAEYCVPDKECVSNDDDDPCDIFRTMAFPIGEFCSGGNTFCDTSHNGRERKCGCSG